MYLWRAERLAADFRDGLVTERHSIGYLLLFLAGLALLENPYFARELYPSEPNQWDALEYMVSFVATVTGTLWCYATFIGKAGRTGFVVRYLCLGLVIGFRLGIIFAVPIITLLSINEFVTPIHWVANNLETAEKTKFDLVTSLIYELLFYANLNWAISKSYA